MKEWAYARSALTIVAPSRWIAGLAAASPLLGRFPIHVIPNGVDVEVFRPLPKEEARHRMGLDPNASVLMFSADSVENPRKGGAFLRAALAQLAEAGAKGIQLLVVGGDSRCGDWGLPYRVHAMGSVHDDKTMATLYSSADLFALPTLADNLPNGILESMACGTPPVTFDVGGCSDAVRHLDTGYLAKCRDADDLASGVTLLLQDAALRRNVSARCRQVIETEYPAHLEARRFLELYEHLIGAGSTR